MIQQFRLTFVLSALAGFLLFFSPMSLMAQQTGNGYLKVKARPGRAGVFVDGKYLGPAANFRRARKYSLPAGEHEVTLSEPRYQEFTTKVNIEAGKTTILKQTLQRLPSARPPFGRLRVVGGDKFAAVFVNGRYMGHLDEFNAVGQGLLLNPGEYTVKIASPGGGQEREEKITIKAKQVTVVRAR
jgi:hypothetical protein